MEEVFQAPQVEAGRGSETMLAAQEVQRMLALQALGWGAKRISRELGCSRNTVRQYLRQGGWRPMDVASRAGVLEPHRQWLAERLRQHHLVGCGAFPVVQALQRELLGGDRGGHGGGLLLSARHARGRFAPRHQG